MKDTQERPKGRYEEVFEKIVNGEKFIMTETTIVGRDFEIMNFQREYKPGIKFPMTWEEM
jgi:hypothetical protein